MGQFARLRIADIRAIDRLVHECRELWADPTAWRQHLVGGASRLTGMAVAHYAEFSLKGANGVARPICRADVGWRDASARSAFVAATAAHPNTLKFFPGFDRWMPRLKRGRQVVALRADLCPDVEWYRTIVYNEFRRPAHLDDNAISAVYRSDGVVAVLDVSQDVADPRPTQRTRRQLALLHALIEPLVGNELATESQQCKAGLSPKLRATLELLLSGQSEKEVAAELGVRPATVHEYVGRVYRHFDVRSRAELMAYFIRRRPKAR